MMGAVTPESDFAVNKYLHAVVSGWIFINIALFLFHTNFLLCSYASNKLHNEDTLLCSFTSVNLAAGL